MIYNIRSGLAFTKATTAVLGGAVGGVVAGMDYNKMRKQGKGRIESLNASIHSNRNQKVVSDNAKKNKAKQVAAAPLRFATMPIGMLHDLATGGLIQVGKNFMPRLKNAATGSTIFNRAEVKSKSVHTDPPNADTKNGGTTNTESVRENSVLNNDGVSSAVEEENKTSDTASDRNDGNGVSGIKNDDNGGDET